jgi:hypothetical protein
MLADLPAIRALVQRGLQLDEKFEAGSFHEAAILLDALPEVMGGSVKSAREHFQRAVAISGDKRASPYMTLAQSVSVMKQDRAEFRRLLGRVLEFNADADPSQRLATIVHAAEGQVAARAPGRVLHRRSSMTFSSTP